MTARTFEVQHGYGPWFKVRTQSSRRFLVVNVKGQWIEKRTDNFETAKTLVRRNPGWVIVDTTGFLQPCTGWDDVGTQYEHRCLKLSANRCEWCREPRCDRHLEGTGQHRHCPYPRHA